MGMTAKVLWGVAQMEWDLAALKTGTLRLQALSGIPVRPDTCYCALGSRGVLHEQMFKAQSISVSVPAGMRELQLELIAVTA
ncbi:hypothetical protein YQ44_06850 [Janthinobacterium sp. 1_2014MBL_MicDiv]|nr:hypothetical protein YQ44_06850 [Janthinobacterium sp. 1_2014MBL_MicDiv]